MKEIFKALGAQIRNLGFGGSGQNYRRIEDDFVFVINLQASRSGERFFVNLGAQPTFIPAECNSELSTLKENECVLRRRVGSEWHWDMDERQRVALIAEINAAQAEFFGGAKTLPSAIQTDPAEELVRKFSSGTTPARATLHLARAAIHLKHFEKADALVELGLGLAGERAKSLIADLKAIRRDNMLQSDV